MGYNQNFKLNPKEIEMIESAIRKELQSLSRQRQTHIESTSRPVYELPAVQRIDEKIKEHNKLLGDLHNQKVWYDTKSGSIGG